MLDAWYFTIITLTTVGFGDYAPSFQDGEGRGSSWLNFFLEIYRTIVLMWMLAGLAWLGGLISMISESLGEILTTMRVGPIVIGPTHTPRHSGASEQPLLDSPSCREKDLEDIPEGNLKFQLR